jgi:hypothetical protein
LIRSRLITGLLLSVALVAIPALAAAATSPITGTSSGTATAQAPEAAASCDPQSPSVPADFICDFDIAGTFTLTNLGTGTYTGTTRLDWSIYTGAAPCAELTGTMVLTNAQGTVTLNMLNTSRVCETASPTQHTSTMNATITGGTGAYVGATGTVTGLGTLDAQATPGVYDAAQTLAGSITTPDPSPTATPTPTPTPSPSTTATVAPSATPAVGLLPDTSSPASDTTLPIVLTLAGLLIASVAYGGFRARRRA